MNFSNSIISAAIFSTVVILSNPISGFAAEDRVNTISVSGTGRVNVAPDMAVVSVGVVREAKTAREALSENNKAMSAVISAMAEKGVEEKDLQTSNFNIQPRYFYPKRKSNGEQPAPEITGYVVSNNLDIRIRDLDKTGEILDLVVTLGVNSGGYIRFMNDDTSAILKDARIAAVKDAIDKAQTLTGAAEVGLGDILTISENANRPRPVPIAQARTLAVQEDAGGSVPVAGGENSYQVTVNISWEIAQ